jgi:Tol biopolymer transport system component
MIGDGCNTPATSDQSGYQSGFEGRELVLEELQRILNSPTFCRSPRHSDLLRYLVKATVAGRQQQISEYSIAADVYRRKDPFNPETDASMRVEVRRLRARLNKYYDGEQIPSPLQISLPAGYVPRFIHHNTNRPNRLTTEPVIEIREALDPASPTTSLALLAEPNSEATFQQIRQQKPLRRAWLLKAIGFVSSGVLALWLVWRQQQPHPIPRPEEQVVTPFPGTQQDQTLSPDATQVAFEWVGDAGDNHDIYAKEVRGGKFRRLTSDPAMDHGPAWSPDGKTIAFLRRLPGLKQGIFLISPNGGPERKISEINPLIAGICWTPNSEALIVPDGPPSVSDALFLLSVKDGSRKRLTGFVGAFHPAISPDGRMLAFGETYHTLTNLAYMRLGRDYMPTATVIQTNAVGAPIMFPTWSRNGEYIYYTSLEEGIWRPYRYRLENGKTELFTALGEGTTAVNEMPGGREFLITRRTNHDVLMETSLRSRNVAPHPLFYSSMSDSNPSVSPDGRLLAFLSTRSGVLGVWISSINGNNARPVTLPGVTPEEPHWSPDSKNLLFSGWIKASAHIYKADAFSAHASEVKLDEADDTDPSYSRDGRWIYFISDISGFHQIWKAPVEGGAPSLVSPSPATYAEESPDSKHLIYSHDSDLYSLSLRDGRSICLTDRTKTETYWDFHAGATGIFCERTGTSKGHIIERQSYTGGIPVSLFSIQQTILGFSLTPDEQSLVYGVQQGDSHIELEPVDTPP